MSEPLKLYWDACPLISYFQQVPEYINALREHVERGKKGQCVIITSTISYAEVYKLPELGGLAIEQSRRILDFLTRNNFVLAWQADRWVCEEAHDIMRLHSGLLPLDAIHLATALQAKCDYLITTDRKQGRRRGLIPHDGRVGDPPMKIQLPNVGMFLPLPGM